MRLFPKKSTQVEFSNIPEGLEYKAGLLARALLRMPPKTQVDVVAERKAGTYRKRGARQGENA